MLHTSTLKAASAAVLTTLLGFTATTSSAQSDAFDAIFTAPTNAEKQAVLSASISLEKRSIGLIVADIRATSK